MRILISLLLICIHLPLFAEVIDTEANSFAQIAILYSKHLVYPDQTLLVFDIDDTLLTMTQPLGGVAWWNWQSGLLINKKDSDMLFVKNKEELARLQNLLFNMVKMQVTDKFVLPFITSAVNSGASIMGLTARGSENLSVTLTQLIASGFHDDKNKLYFNQNGLKLKNSESSFPGHFHCEHFARYVAYYHGIMFLDGQAKGPALNCILSHSIKPYRTIFFIDDVQHNLDSVRETFNNRNDLKIINILYTHEHAKEHHFLTNQDLQVKAFKQWQAIKATLQQNIAYPNV